MPSPSGATPQAGFSAPIVEPPPGEPSKPDLLVRGPDDARIVRGELSEDRTEVAYDSPWGRVVVPFNAFSWILELPEKPAKEKTR